MNTRGFKSGFTLIEILVVVSIFGLISSVALANLQSARQKAEVAAGQQFHGTVERSLGVDVIGKWRFDEGAGNLAQDFSGNGLDGEIVGATYVSDGMSGYALLFDGNDYITGNGFPNPGTNAKLTVIAWLKPTNIAANNTIFNAGGTTCTAFQIGVAGGKTFSVSSPNSTQVVAIDEEISDERIVVNNSWQNTAFVYNGNTTEMYINGVKKSTTVNTGTSDCPDEEWTIGSTAQSSFGQGYQGTMDELGVYGSALTASEIQKIYAQGLEDRNSVLVKN